MSLFNLSLRIPEYIWNTVLIKLMSLFFNGSLISIFKDLHVGFIVDWWYHCNGTAVWETGLKKTSPNFN